MGSVNRFKRVFYGWFYLLPIGVVILAPGSPESRPSDEDDPDSNTSEQERGPCDKQHDFDNVHFFSS